MHRSIFIALITLVSVSTGRSDEIIHDAEHNILEAQNAKKWAADDKAVDAILAQARKKSGGKPPHSMAMRRLVYLQSPIPNSKLVLRHEGSISNLQFQISNFKVQISSSGFPHTTHTS